MTAGDQLAPAIAFADAARRYWLGVFPSGRRELRHWRLRAGEILDPVLRRLAVEAQHTKRESLEGAIAFATFAPRASRNAVIRALTAYQTAFDYIDTVSEQPNVDPIANGRRLNEALLRALEPDGLHCDYYAHHNQCEDAGYLCDLVDTCRTALNGLPSYAAITDTVRGATARVVSYQALNHGDAYGSLDAFARWARAETKSSTDLSWWEAGAAGGSPLPVFALFAAAASPATEAEDAAAVEGAYFPWIASLNSLLDNLVDRREDAADGQRNLIDYYNSPAETATRLQTLASRAVNCAKALSDGRQHTMILAAMAGFYHTDPQASAPDACLATQRILDTMAGDFAVLATLVLRLRRAIGNIVGVIAAVRNAFAISAVRDAFGRMGRPSTLFAMRIAVLGLLRHGRPMPGLLGAIMDVRDYGRIPALGEEAPHVPPAPGLAGRVDGRLGRVLDSLRTDGCGPGARR
jgi:tetraprenyl-beta-curcumene synthase